MSTRMTEDDIERMILDCLPCGYSCDPQMVADDIRAWFAVQQQFDRAQNEREARQIVSNIRKAWGAS